MGFLTPCPLKCPCESVTYVLGPEGNSSGASLLTGPPAIPYGAGLRLVLSLLLLFLFLSF